MSGSTIMRLEYLSSNGCNPHSTIICFRTPGYGSSKGRCLLCLDVSGGSAAISTYSRVDFKPFPQVTMVLMKNPFHISRKTSLVCSANSNNHKRNPDFSRQNKQNGFFRNKNRQNPERHNSQNLEESELLSSKNGSLLSLSSNPRFQATAIPGPREKEIVELFRKVQILLRERASANEEKKEISPGQSRESEPVDSLLKLLRKHSVEPGKRSDQSEQNDPFNGQQNTSFFGSNTSPVENEHKEPNTNPFIRPLSNFRRKSPVPRVKYQPVYSTKDSINIASHSKSQGWTKKVVVDPEPEPKPEPVSADIHELSNEMPESESSDTDEAYNNVVVETTSNEHTDLSKLKLVELRELAKSRGVRGYSKLKKSELIELISEKIAD